jgi:histidyl-tRNA synthetase
MKKQMKYANDKNVKFIALVGDEEISENVIQLKNMKTGEQEGMSIEEAIAFIKNNK